MYDIFISYNTKDQAIADELYRRFREEGFTCFLATKDLNGADWAGDIVNALEDSRGFVIIVSRNSNASNEVLKEVNLATRFSRYIFPFMIDDTKMDRRMEYHLAPFQWISAVMPPMELRYQDLMTRVRDALQGTMTEGNVNYDKMELIGQKLSPRAEFTGREQELEQIREVLDQGNAAVFLCGMGGIGKSEIARAFAARNRDRYKTVVMAAFQTDLTDLITDDRSVVIKGCTRGGVNSGQMETEEDYYARKLEALQSVVNEETLLILDNFDTEEDPKLQDFLDLECDKIIATRTNFEDLGYPVIHVEPMDVEEVLLPLMEKLDHKYVKPQEREAVLEIIALLGAHTYAVSLTASQMRAGHIRPEKMLEMLRTEGLRYQTRSTFARSAGAEKKSASEYIRMLFDFSALSEREAELMRYLACSPQDGIDIDLFMELAEIDDFEELRHLIVLNWVQEDGENNLCRIHKLVRELVLEQLTPTPENCRSYIHNLAKRMRGSGGWNNTYEENLSLEAPTLALLENLPTPTVDLLDEYNDLQTFAWVMNHFAESEKVCKIMYDLAVEHFGEISEEASYQATKMGGVYHNQCDFANAAVWFRKSKDTMPAGEESTVLAQAVFKVARSEMMAGDLESAEAGYREANAIAERVAARGNQELCVGSGELPEENWARELCCFSRAGLGLILGGRGEYTEAVAILKQQIEDLHRVDPDSTSHMYFRMALGMIYSLMGEHEQAIKTLQEMLDYCKGLHGDNWDCVQITEMCGDALIVAGKPQEAASYYADALNKAETNFPGNTADIRNLETKYENARSGQCFEIPYRYLAL